MVVSSQERRRVGRPRSGRRAGRKSFNNSTRHSAPGAYSERTSGRPRPAGAFGRRHFTSDASGASVTVTIADFWPAGLFAVSQHQPRRQRWGMGTVNSNIFSPKRSCRNELGRQLTLEEQWCSQPLRGSSPRSLSRPRILPIAPSTARAVGDLCRQPVIPASANHASLSHLPLAQNYCYERVPGEGSWSGR